MIEATPKMAQLQATIECASDPALLKVKQAVIFQELEAAQQIIAAEQGPDCRLRPARRNLQPGF